MVTNFHYDPELECERLIAVYWSIGRNIYQDHGFYVLPYRVPGNPSTIYLPKVESLDNKQIVSELRLLDNFTVPHTDEGAIKWSNIIKNLIGKPEPVDTKHIREVEKEWKTNESAFENYLYNIFPRLRNINIKLDIYWTRYGSLMSYTNPVVRGVKSNISVYLRDDMGAGQIIEGLLSAILIQTFGKLETSWLQRETIVDFAILETGLKHFATSFYPTVLAKNKFATPIGSKYILDSSKYINTIDSKNSETIIVKGKVVYIHEKPSKLQFGQTECNFINALIKNPNEPLSYFDLSDMVWGNSEDSFSLWALSQLAYKVKNKIRKCGLNPEIVKNVRGVGYMYIPQG